VSVYAKGRFLGPQGNFWIPSTGPGGFMPDMFLIPSGTCVGKDYLKALVYYSRDHPFPH